MKKNFTFILLGIFLIFAMSLGITACADDTTEQDKSDIDRVIKKVTTQLGDLSAVISNLTLPVWVDGVGIQWKSSDTSVLRVSDINGIVTRPESESDASVTLSGVFFKNSVSKKKDYTVTVTRMPPQGEADIDAAIASVRASLGDLTAVTGNLTLPLQVQVYGVTVTWSSDNPSTLSDTGVVNRPPLDAVNITVTLTGTFTKGGITKQAAFTVTVMKIQPASYDDVLKKIRKAEVALGDLSTVDSNITLPATDSLVTVNWASSNTSALSNTGTVTRSSGHVELTLTGTFTFTADTSVFATKTWKVRVMRNGAAWDEYLNVHYKVDGGVLKNAAWSGDFYQATPMSGAAVATSSQSAAAAYNGGQYINLGSGGYIDLGPKVGSLLRKGEWTVEFFIRIPGDSGTMLSFANNENINNTANSPWRGTMIFNNPGLYFRAMNNGANGITGTDNGGSNNQTVYTGNSAGISGNRTNEWVHLALVKRTDNTIRIVRNYGRAQNGVGTDVGRITTNAIFGSGDEELEDLRFGYLGRSVLASSGYTNSDAKLSNVTANTPNNTWIYEFKAYSKSVPLTGTNDEYPNMGAAGTAGTLRGDKKVMNDAFSLNNND